jgi:hypothetical protein
MSSCKNSKKNLDSYYFVTLFGFLSLENYVNVPSNSNKQKKCLNKNSFLLASILKVNDEKSRIRIQDPNPDPLVRGMDPGIRIRIHSKMSWIWNTGFYIENVSKIKRFQPILHFTRNRFNSEVSFKSRLSKIRRHFQVSSRNISEATGCYSTPSWTYI